MKQRQTDRLIAQHTLKLMNNRQKETTHTTRRRNTSTLDPGTHRTEDKDNITQEAPNLFTYTSFANTQPISVCRTT